MRVGDRFLILVRITLHFKYTSYSKFYSSNGLTASGDQTSGYEHSSTIGVSSGKWYFEMRATQIQMDVLWCTSNNVVRNSDSDT